MNFHVKDLAIQTRFGRNLKSARIRCGLTQDFVAMNVGIPVEFLVMIEVGTADPDLETVGNLAKVVGCAVPDLLKR